jgi:glucose/arabinose dehydrogenase
MRVAQPLSDHGPGTIAFNPTALPGSADYGTLYIGFGDGGGVGDPYGNAQDLGSPLGKILRIDPAAGPNGQAYTVPADNPYVDGSGQRTEVWASGLRNPQQFGWNADTGQMLIADIGQSQLEEINIGVKGGNYGWPAREGTFGRGPSWDPNVYDTPNDGSFLDPVTQFDHEEITRGGMINLAAISGVFAYTGSLVPELRGMTVLSELVSGRLFYYDPLSIVGTQTAVLRELGLSFEGIDTTLGQRDANPYIGGGRVDLRMGSDGDGELYLLSKSLGNIYRLTSLTAVPEPASWMMMIVGAGLIGGALRRQRRAPVATCS